MNILAPEFRHSDARRTLTQLITDNIKQVNSYEIKRGSILGEHFHKETVEYFYITKGTALVRVDDNSVVMNRGSIFKVIPTETHSVEALTDLGLMTFLTVPFSQDKPDLWKKS